MWFWILAILVGLAVSSQSAFNAALARKLGVWGAVFIASAICTMILAGVAMLSGGLRQAVRYLPQVPPRLFVGGVAGAIILVGMVIVVRKIGVGPAVAIGVASQLVAAVIIDHLGLLGSPPSPVSLHRAFGIVLLVLGAWMVKA